MQDQIKQELEKLARACLGDKSRLKEVAPYLEQISTVDSTDPVYWSLFDTAVFSENDTHTEQGNAVAKMLITKGLSVTAPQPNGSDGTLLHITAGRGNFEMTEFLVEEKQANLNEKDGQQRTPLKVATEMLANYDPVDEAYVIENIKKVIKFLQEKQLNLVSTGQPRIAKDSPLYAGPAPATSPDTPSSETTSPSAGSPRRSSK